MFLCLWLFWLINGFLIVKQRQIYCYLVPHFIYGGSASFELVDFLVYHFKWPAVLSIPVCRCECDRPMPTHPRQRILYRPRACPSIRRGPTDRSSLSYSDLITRNTMSCSPSSASMVIVASIGSGSSSSV